METLKEKLDKRIKSEKEAEVLFAEDMLVAYRNHNNSEGDRLRGLWSHTGSVIKGLLIAYELMSDVHIGIEK